MTLQIKKHMLTTSDYITLSCSLCNVLTCFDDLRAQGQGLVTRRQGHESQDQRQG